MSSLANQTSQLVIPHRFISQYSLSNRIRVTGHSISQSGRGQFSKNWLSPKRNINCTFSLAYWRDWSCKLSISGPHEKQRLPLMKCTEILSFCSILAQISLSLSSVSFVSVSALKLYTREACASMKLCVCNESRIFDIIYYQSSSEGVYSMFLFSYSLHSWSLGSNSMLQAAQRSINVLIIREFLMNEVPVAQRHKCS